MDLSGDELDQLLGAWALGALDPDEQAAVDEALTADADVGLTAAGLTAADLAAVVALMGEVQAVSPPPDLRAAVLSQAARSAPIPVEPTAPVTVAANQVAALQDLLGRLSDDDWSAPAHPYLWSVHGLVAHLLVIERYTARQLGLTVDRPTNEPLDHLAMGADEIEAELARPPRDTARSWYEAARLVVDSGPDLDSIVTLHGWPFSVRGLLAARGFELWTHADDIRRATGRPLGVPAPGDLRAMSQFSVGTLPLVWSLDAQAPDLPQIRLVLTGDGGGTFDLARPDGAGEHSSPVLLVLDVVDYCRVVARRAELHEVAAVVEGGDETVSRLVAAAQILAV